MSFKMRMVLHEVINGLGFGLFLAIQGVFFLQKGLELWQIGLVFAAIGGATALFELPFGAVADIHGRLKVFRISVIVRLLATALALLSPGFAGLLVAAVLWGLSQALNSGSIDAWVVERVKDMGEEARLQSYIGSFQGAMAAGMTLGAILGGYLPAVMPETHWFVPTGWNLLALMLLGALNLALMPVLFPEGEVLTPPQDRETLARQLKSGIGFALGNRTLRAILVLGVFLGLAMASLDAYWQPRLVEIAGKPTYAAFGWITAGYFAMAILGAVLIGPLAEWANVSARVQVMLLPLLLAGVLFALSRQGAFWPYVGAYLSFMLVFSMINPPVETLLNRETPDEIRSTMQSLLSLVLTLGGAVSMLLFAPVVRALGIAATWGILAGVLALAAGLLALSGLRKRA